MSIPGSLYDASGSPAQLIAAVRLSTTRRAAYGQATVRHKLDDGWPQRVGGAGAVEMRVTAEGIFEDASWIATLYARQDARTAAPYLVSMADGDSHAGSFVVEEFSERADSEERRRFSLTLLSSGKITYTPAP